jgi:hypothetical protein
VLIRAEVYQHARSLLDEALPPLAAQFAQGVAPIMLESRQAFWREVPEVLKRRSKACRWVAYDGTERIATGRTDAEVYQECLRRGLQRGEFYVASISERTTPPWAVEPLEDSLYGA